MNKIAILLILLFAVGFSQTSINSGASFLKIGVGAKNISTGNVGILTTDVTGAYYNPATLTLNTQTEFHFTHNSWMNDVTNQYFATKFILWQIPFAFSISNFRIEDIEVYTNPGEPEATFRANFLAANFSTAIKISEKLSVGTTIKYLYEGIYTNEATGYGFDFGGYYSNIFENVNLAISLQNLGSISEFRAEKIELPTSVSFGADYQIPFEEFKVDSKFILATKQYFNNEPTHFHYGTEFAYDNLFFIRAGYFSGYEAKSYSAGIGLNWKNIQLDYAYSPFDYSLGNSHIISFSYNY